LSRRKKAKGRRLLDTFYIIFNIVVDDLVVDLFFVDVVIERIILRIEAIGWDGVDKFRPWRVGLDLESIVLVPAGDGMR
jgi:hypothetical protein